MNNMGYSPAQVWQEQVKTKASTAKLESILTFMEVCGLIKFTKEERLDKRIYKRSKVGKRDSAIIAENLKIYFDLSADNKDAKYELNEDGYLQRVKKSESTEDPIEKYGYNHLTGEFETVPEEDVQEDSITKLMIDIAPLMERASQLGVTIIIKNK